MSYRSTNSLKCGMCYDFKESYREVMDLISVTDIRKRLPIKFSYRGNEAVRKVCDEKLSDFFQKNTLLWKRCSRQYSFSYRAHLFFEFVPFSTDTLINYKSSKPKTWEEASLLHLFFLNPSTVTEYRNEYKNEVSEWFTVLSKIEGTEWLIVFDSLEAREKRNRGALIERIKSDFAKFTNRIVEIYDLSNIVALQNSVQSHLLNSLEDYVTHEENSLSKRNDRYRDPNFEFITFCRDQMSLSRLYQSLGMSDQMLALFDELDAILSLIALHHSSDGPIPKWLASPKSSVLMSSGCPLFTAMLKYDAPWDNITIIELRYIILTHQIMNAIRIYNERLQRVSTSADSSSQDLKTEFAVKLLRYSQHCLDAIFESMVVFKIPLDCDEMQCWVIVFCLETMQLASLLTEITHVEQAAHLICSLKLAKCRAMSKLNERWNSVDWKMLSKWFEEGIARCGVETVKTNAVNEIRQLLSDRQQFTHYMQKYHESCIALLKHFGWRRQARAVGWELAKFLLSSDRTEGALPYLLNFISDLIADGSPVLLLRDTLLCFVNHLEKLIDFYLILMKLAKTEEERVSYCDKLLELSEKPNISKIRLDSHYKQHKTFCFGFNSPFPFVTAAPNEIIKIDVKITSHFPKSLRNFKLYCLMKTFVRNGSQKPTAGRRPHFQCVYNEGGVSRFECVWKGNTAVRKGSLLEFDMNSATESEDCLIFRSFAADELKPVYVFDHFELEIGHCLILRCDWLDVPEIETDLAQLPACFVHSKPVSLKLKPPPNGVLLAGITQHVEFEISLGTGRSLGDGNSILQDIARSEWSEICNYSLDNMSGGNETITVYLYKILRNLSNSNENVRSGPPMCAAQILVRWMDKEWSFSIDFVSFMTICSDTSLLEERVLFELVIFRDIDEWLIMPQEATLRRINCESSQVLAELLNPKLTDIQPGGKYRLVWIMPTDKRNTDEVEHYELRFTYRVKSLERHTADEELIYNREYTLVDEFLIPCEAPNYELCAQMLSSQPGAVLCRVEDPCDMIVSLRSLTNRVETVVVSVEADPCFWTITEKHKLLHVKESGLGQISFTVFPKMIGFLPYPLITVYSCRSSSDVSRSSNESNNVFGPRLSSFIRTNGKQVHVLGAFASSTEPKDTPSTKTSRLKEAKSRLTKLFD
uniref:TRAPPC10/Trs130 N-terminal domain-containing protein n=1 Tax=Setaria digitata TaxID=48799 RepID=A0A915PL93_9BILA